MPCPDRLAQWKQEVSTAFGHLSKPQVWGLVLWSAGIALSGAAGITQISALLALVLDQQEQAMFQRLREWYLDAKHKSGKKRRELDVTTCFAPLLRWIVQMTGKREQANGPGTGCHDAWGALDDFVDQRGDPQLRYSGGVESAGRT